MAESIEIAAETRDVIGKSAHKLAAVGKLPAVMYGSGQEPKPIQVDRHDFERVLSQHGEGSTLVSVKIDGGKPVNAIIKDIHHDPVKGTVQHVDLWAVSMKQRISASVQLRFVNDAAGVKTGGVLTHSLTEVQIEALPTGIPEVIEVDVSALEVGDNLHVSDIVPPEGVTITSPAEDIVVSVTPPTVAPSEEESAQVAEPEVIGSTKDEAE